MKKIISLFARNYDGDRLIRNEITPGAEWVIAGEGIATTKYDGTCCMVRDGKMYKRYDAKHGKTPPANFEKAQEYDEITGHMPGWIPVGDRPEDQWHREAFAAMQEWLGHTRDGTYELCGPKINGNPEQCEHHRLTLHGYGQLPFFPRTFDEIKKAFEGDCQYIEGVVWHHSDGRMCKVKMKDFGLGRKPNPEWVRLHRYANKTT